MALSVDYSVFPYLITCPTSDLAFISGTRYQITVDYLWQLLRDYADSSESIVWPIIFTRTAATASTPPIIEVNADYYAFQFEDGAYSVEIVNGNSNIRNVEVKNTVSIGTNNTTGFINPKFLESGLFGGYITVDAVNGVSGTTYTPEGGIIGTQTTPSNNMQDALTIAIERGIFVFKLYGNITLGAETNTPTYTYEGRNAASTNITLLPAAEITDCEFWSCFVSGTLDGGVIIRDSVVGSLQYLNGIIHQTMIVPGTIQIGGGLPAYFLNCFAGAPAGLNLDLNGAHHAYLLNWRGSMTIRNGIAGSMVIADSGTIVIDSSCVDVEVYSTGDLHIDDYGTNTIVHQDSMHEFIEYMSAQLNDIYKVNFNKRDNVANRITIYEDDKVTPFKTFNTNEAVSEIDPI